MLKMVLWNYTLSKLASNNAAYFHSFLNTFQTKSPSLNIRYLWQTVTFNCQFDTCIFQEVHVVQIILTLVPMSDQRYVHLDVGKNRDVSNIPLEKLRQQSPAHLPRLRMQTPPFRVSELSLVFRVRKSIAQFSSGCYEKHGVLMAAVSHDLVLSKYSSDIVGIAM